MADIIKVSEDIEEHLHHVDEILTTLRGRIHTQP